MDWVVRSLQGEVLRYKSGLASRIFVVAAAFMACLFLTYMQYAYAEMPVPPEPHIVKVTIKRAKAPEPPEPSVVKVTIKRSQGLEPPEPSVVKVTIKRSQAPEPPEPSVVKITLKREKARDTADQYLIDPNALFKIPDVQGSMTGFQALSVEPPRITLTIGKISQPF